MTISKPPRILTVQFLRFTMTGRKINKYIKFPKCFNLRVFVSENVDAKIPKEKQNDHIYSLYGVIVHSGKSCKSGHYYSFIRKDEKWYLCNDESITEVKDMNRILKQNAYILFYKYKISNPNKNNKKQTAKNIDSSSLDLNRTKSISAEIKESQNNKNNFMPLSGLLEQNGDVNSEEEEEKLVKKDTLTKPQLEKYKKLDHILANFEDIDLKEIKDLD